MSTKYLWWTNSACESTGKEKMLFSLSLCQLLGKSCCKKLVILKGNRSSSTSQVMEGKSTPLQCKQTNSAEQSRVTAKTVKLWRPNRKPKVVKLNNTMTHWMLTRKKSFQMSVFDPKQTNVHPTLTTSSNKYKKLLTLDKRGRIKANHSKELSDNTCSNQSSVECNKLIIVILTVLFKYCAGFV